MIIDFINEKCSLLVEILLNNFMKMSGLNQILILLAVLFLAIIGGVSVAKKTIKTAIVIGLIFVIVVALWSLFSFVI
ncbi:MAG: hypothetical protein IJD76_01115 [Bacilli bacterium]|nr:hypothetical protein [Bacilli bacterium]